MSLREKLNKSGMAAVDPRKATFERFGVIDNPFPAAAQPTGHPRYDESEADTEIVGAIQRFERDYASQVLVIEGTQGIGKTNLLNYYQSELKDIYQEDTTFYIIRYYPDPEPTFDAIVRRVFQELNFSHFERIGKALAELDRSAAEEVIEIARSHEVRMVLTHLLSAARTSDEELRRVADMSMEWLVGLRLLNRHRETLGVMFRLDTVESKTQALRDVVFVSEKLDLLKGIFLLLDELEKQDYSLSKTPVLRYLLAIRALIDALPKRLFLVIALTTDARRRYYAMLPAIAGRLQNRIVLQPIQTEAEALKFAHFYVDCAKKRAKDTPEVRGWKEGKSPIIDDREVRSMFLQILESSAERGTEGVIHREFLNALNQSAERKMGGR